MSRYRHEYKYFIDKASKQILNIKLSGIMRRDPHVNDNNQYVIRSLYMDNINNECLEENASGTDNRSKFRIRYYNNDTSRIVLEKKSKIRGMCLKESCQISRDECLEMMKGHVPEIKNGDSEIKKKLFTEARLKGMMPAAIVTYVRTPFIYKGGNVRVTFDEDITSSTDFEKFLDGNYRERPILEVGKLILEVKWDELLPEHIKSIMSLENYIWTAFSKYYMCRMMHL